MGTELQMLAWAIVLGLVHLMLDAGIKTSERGLAWNASARDGEAKPLGPVAGRVNRSWSNFLETFPMFAAAVLAVVVAGRTDGNTALGAQLYFWARLAYIPLYAAGIPYVRSLVWAVSLAGIVLVLSGLF
ncbi:MAPEG family protein [Luteimonas sp. MC1750]|uniref:MAPEG family protein n=1 Tax=Luteimonas sp. MC1750 TaxID=2799326 RepID=UPI0018F0F0DE|nr:MAPEG family protein [Luteimonas sp. MC1750]MBJ6983758.1 MAPEG family protein [Luteimonas sp. MC1750]QQO06590.1 MAPEG family protein [Luteimonas sp. MC1750]